MKEYIKVYHKRNIKLALFGAGMVFVPLFVVSLFYDVVLEDMFVPFALAAVCVLVASVYTIRFKKMIEEQEKIYNIQFQDEDVECLENILYLSKDWLIWAGSCAFYKRHIKSIKDIRRYGRGGSSSQVIIKTIDNKKYTIWCRSTSNVKKIKKWKNGIS